MQPVRPYVSVVIPAYNEERRLCDSIPLILDFIDREGLQAEVLVVDDGSTDETAAVAEKLLAGKPGRLLRVAENRGKGHAVRRGFLEAAGRWVLVTDADLSTPIEEYSNLAGAARDQELDVVIGSRALPDSRVEVHQHFVRETMGKTFNLLLRAMTGLPFRDTQCGFKLLDRERTLPLFRRMVVDRFAWDVELLFLCVRFGLKVRDVPVVWRNSPDSRVGLFGDPVNMLWDVARVRWRFRSGAYNPSEEEATGGARGR